MMLLYVAEATSIDGKWHIFIDLSDTLSLTLTQKISLIV